MKNHPLIMIFVLALAFGFLSACNNNSSSSDSVPLTLSLTDGAVDYAEQVNLAITGLEVKSQNQSYRFDFATKAINLLALQGSEVVELINDEALPSGDYQWIRLFIDQASIVLEADGSEIPLTIPSADQSGLKLISGFTLASNNPADFTIDFDLRKSLTVSGPTQNPVYKLTPAMRLINNIHAGHVSGTVNATLCETGSSMAVYAFQGVDAELNDEGSANPPIASSLVDDGFNYEIGFLIAAEYTLALTCIADQDDPLVDETFSFIAQLNASVLTKQNSQYNFD